jgi:hypothetical protein
MADFCAQCSIDLFGEDFGDLADITPIEQFERGLACCVLCEDCGPIQVDPLGRCISTDCAHHHGEQDG